MALPTLLVRYSVDDADDPSPTWVDVTDDVRSFSTSRGRDSERSVIGAGTATIVLNNRNGDWDPVNDATLAPMNRWNIQAVLSASTEDVFLGYAESYGQQWPGVGHDAVTVVSLVDEFKVLAQDSLPVTDPPRDTYADVIAFDEPHGYWRMQGQLEVGPQGPVQPVTGSALLSMGNGGRVSNPIVGDWPVDVLAGVAYGARSTLSRLTTLDASTMLAGLDVGGPGDAGGLSAFTFETWFKSSEATPATDRAIAVGPLSGGVPQWRIILNTAGTIRALARNSGGTTYTATSVSTITADVWYHIAIVVTGSNTLLYRDGMQAAQTSFTGSFGGMDAGGFLEIGETPAPGGTRYYDEPAFYRYALSLARVDAHYTAGVLRGFPPQDPGARITAVLAASSSVAASSIRAGSREMTPAFMAGRPPLDMLREAESADAVDAVLFIAKDGTVTFLDDGHRSSSPWNTVQATFDDDGTDLPYQDISLDYSDSFIANEWNVTRRNGTLTTTSDATSISRYGKRSESLTDLPITTDSDVTAIGTAMLAKYKDPMTRITSLAVITHPDATAEAIVPLELGDRIRVFRTPMGGGSRIDQTLFIQKIDVQGAPAKPWTIRLGVSPL